MPAVPFVDYWSGLFSLNETYLASIHERADSCGYTEYFDTYLTFPPPGPAPDTLNSSKPGCDLWDEIYYAVSSVNPCFDIYQVATTCPLLWDVLGFPGSFDYLPEGASIYFNRSDVQAAINAPQGLWEECSSDDVFINGTDNSLPPVFSVLPSVIERLNKTVIANGILDYIIMSNGTLFAIQNMTWGGAQGFQSRPSGEFFVVRNDFLLNVYCFGYSRRVAMRLVASTSKTYSFTHEMFLKRELLTRNSLIMQKLASAPWLVVEFLARRTLSAA